MFQPAIKAQSKPKAEITSNDESSDKRLKQLRKKLDQITKLKEKQEKGEVLEQNQACTLYYKCVVCFNEYTSRSMIVGQVNN